MLPGYARKEPDYIAAGTTVLFERFLGSYPASDGWSLTYSIIGLGAQVTFQSVADGNAHAITIPAATTALWVPTNDSKLTGYAVNAGLGQEFQIYSMSCPITPNLINPPADQPSQTFLQKVIKQLEELYLTKGNDDILMAHVGDSSFKFESKKEVWEALCMARAERRIEVAKERARNGKPSTRRIIPVVSITPPGPLFGGQWPSDYLTD
jgi:hypothetical protein